MRKSSGHFHLKVITPRGKEIDERVVGLIAQAEDGLFGIYAGHEPLIAALSAGRMKIIRDGGEHLYSAGAGVLEVGGDHDVLVLADNIAEGMERKS